MKENLIFKVRERDKENAHGMMVLIMRVNGQMVKEMELVYMLKKMELYIKANGKMI
jgi:hypothetical protein